MLIPCTLSQYAGVMEKVNHYASTLQARDYKGFGNQATNGVIVNGKRCDNWKIE